mmetsp:Transcript_6275/g.9238  ORF Transcript_6275/g.9238 Transcript_6275/m.9238 type:complete len:205 (+) Transcript_6275:84-698(+)
MFATDNIFQEPLPAFSNDRVLFLKEIVDNGDKDKSLSLETNISRRERKRIREKDRRTETNNQFSRLNALLQQINADNFEDDDSKGKSIAKKAESDSAGFSKVNLIARAKNIVEYEYNKKKKLDDKIASLKVEIAEEAKKMMKMNKIDDCSPERYPSYQQSITSIGHERTQDYSKKMKRAYCQLTETQHGSQQLPPFEQSKLEEF